MKPQTRRRYAKGRWMKLRNPDLLVRYMEAQDFSQARLARYAGCSRQFIHMLISGDRNTCTPAIATRIEEAMRVLPKTLFEDHESPTGRPEVRQRKKAAA